MQGRAPLSESLYRPVQPWGPPAANSCDALGVCTSPPSFSGRRQLRDHLRQIYLMRERASTLSRQAARSGFCFLPSTFPRRPPAPDSPSNLAGVSPSPHMETIPSWLKAAKPAMMIKFSDAHVLVGAGRSRLLGGGIPPFRGRDSPDVESGSSLPYISAEAPSGRCLSGGEILSGRPVPASGPSSVRTAEDTHPSPSGPHARCDSLLLFGYFQGFSNCSSSGFVRNDTVMLGISFCALFAK